VESPGSAVVEEVKAASANGMDRNADAKMQMAKRSLLISHHVPHSRGLQERPFPCY
jgi:hypothetical protein